MKTLLSFAEIWFSVECTAALDCLRRWRAVPSSLVFVFASESTLVAWCSLDEKRKAVVQSAVFFLRCSIPREADG